MIQIAMGESVRYSALEACCAELNGEVAMMGRTVERLAQTNGALVSLSESMARFVAAATAVRASFDAAESEASAAAAGVANRESVGRQPVGHSVLDPVSHPVGQPVGQPVGR